ncbi:MAG: ribosome maturation factor RimP [Clostridia bacterium]|nr:ribosome maturation factor RimP [Clostridia bacterium]
MAKIEEMVSATIQDTVTSLGCEIYDVEYLKEGSNWYLRIYIDKPEGVSIEDCEAVSRAIDPIIDELNPIKTAYSLEVSSPGLERVLRKSEHFEKNLNKLVEVSLFKAVSGSKKMQGILKSADTEQITIEVEHETISLNRQDVSKVNLVYEF